MQAHGPRAQQRSTPQPAEGAAAACSGSGEPLLAQQHQARPGERGSARFGCAGEADGPAGGQPQAVVAQAHGPRLPARKTRSASRGAPASRGAAEPQAVQGSAQRPARSGKAAAACMMAPKAQAGWPEDEQQWPTRPHFDDMSKTTSSAAAVLPAHQDQDMQQCASATALPSARTAQHGGACGGARSGTVAANSAPAAGTATQDCLVSGASCVASKGLAQSGTCTQQAGWAAGPVQDSRPAKTGTAPIGAKRKRKLEAQPCRVVRPESAEPDQAVWERERKQLRAALVSVRAAAASCKSLHHMWLQNPQAGSSTGSLLR